MRRAMWLGLSLAVGMTGLYACNGDSGDDDETGGGIPDPDDTGQECDTTNAPTFTLEAEAGTPDWYETEQGVKCLPTVIIRAVNVEDIDGDLVVHKMDVWFDDVLDGAVGTDGVKSRIQQRVDGGDCEVTSLPGISMRLGIAGGGTSSPAFDTETEFGVVIIDDANNESYDGVPQVIQVKTPSAVANDSECPDRG